MIFDRRATMPTRLVVPLRCFPLTTFFMDLWWVVPIAMNFYGAAADLAIRGMPRALFVVVRNVVPIFMIFDRRATVAT